MSWKENEMEAFLRNVKSGVVAFSDEATLLAKEAEKGEYPCNDCSRKRHGPACDQMNCFPYYKYFQFRWRRLQRGLLQK